MILIRVVSISIRFYSDATGLMLISFMIFAESVKGSGTLIPHVVKFWVERYEKDPKPAMVELLMMLFEVVWNFLSINLFKGELK